MGAFPAPRASLGGGLRSLLRPLDPAGPAGDGRAAEVSLPAADTAALVVAPGARPGGFRLVFLRMFVDAFRAPRLRSACLATLNGPRVPVAQAGLVALDQTGPIGKLPTIAPLVELHAALAALKLELPIDDPTRGVRRRVIEGHADGIGGTAFNQALSEARARSVVEWLAARGVAAGQLSAAGHGPSRPVAENGTIAGRALDRRAEAAPLR